MFKRYSETNICKSCSWILMRLVAKSEYLIVPKRTKFTGSGKLGLISGRIWSMFILDFLSHLTEKKNQTKKKKKKKTSSVWTGPKAGFKMSKWSNWLEDKYIHIYKMKTDWMSLVHKMTIKLLSTNMVFGRMSLLTTKDIMVNIRDRACWTCATLKYLNGKQVDPMMMFSFTLYCIQQEDMICLFMLEFPSSY